MRLSTGACVRVLLLTALAGLAAYVTWGLTHPPVVPQPPVSAAAADSGRQKAERLLNAHARARASGEPVPVSETFTDAELSSLVSEAAQRRGAPVDDISVHVPGDGTIQGQAEARVRGQHIPFYLVFQPQFTDRQDLRIHVLSSKVAGLPLPGPIADSLGSSIPRTLALPSLQGVRQIQVSTRPGELTVRGVADP